MWPLCCEATCDDQTECLTDRSTQYQTPFSRFDVNGNQSLKKRGWTTEYFFGFGHLAALTRSHLIGDHPWGLTKQQITETMDPRPKTKGLQLYPLGSIVSVICSFVKPQGWSPIRWDLVGAARLPGSVWLRKNPMNQKKNPLHYSFTCVTNGFKRLWLRAWLWLNIHRYQPLSSHFMFIFFILIFIRRFFLHQFHLHFKDGHR